MKKLLVIFCAALVAAFSFMPFTVALAEDAADEQGYTVSEDIEETETDSVGAETQPPAGEADGAAENPPADMEMEVDLEAVADKFKSYLMRLYGEDYGYYYDQIVAQWGSIEAYLLQFGQEHLTEEQQTGWNKFVGWLSDYSPVWAPVFALVTVIAVAVVGKKKFNEILAKAVNAKVDPIVAELNKQSSALAALMDSAKALLPKTGKFAENAEQLEKSAKELTDG